MWICKRLVALDFPSWRPGLDFNCDGRGDVMTCEKQPGFWCDIAGSIADRLQMLHLTRRRNRDKLRLRATSPPNQVNLFEKRWDTTAHNS